MSYFWVSQSTMPLAAADMKTTELLSIQKFLTGFLCYLNYFLNDQFLQSQNLINPFSWPTATTLSLTQAIQLIIPFGYLVYFIETNVDLWIDVIYPSKPAHKTSILFSGRTKARMDVYEIWFRRFNERLLGWPDNMYT